MFSFLSALLPFSSSLTTLLSSSAPPVLLHHDISPVRQESVVDAYLRGAYLLDPFYVHACESPGTRVVRLKDIQPDHFRMTEFFRSYYAHARLADEIGILVERENGAHIFVSLGLAAGTGRFSRRGHERLVRFLPVIAALSLRNWGHVRSNADTGNPRDRTARHFALQRILELGDFASMTRREREVVVLMLLGHSSKAIARQLEIAVGTVKNHRKHVYRKLAVGSQSALFARFISLISQAAPHMSRK